MEEYEKDNGSTINQKEKQPRISDIFPFTGLPSKGDISVSRLPLF